MMRKLRSFLFALTLLAAGTIAFGQEPPALPVAAVNKVEGLELPADQSVAPDEGFISITAKCKGTVKWLVVSNVKVKFVTNDATNSIIVSVPTTPGTVVNVFAVGLVDGKQTEFVRTSVQVNGQPLPPPNPNPNPNPNPQPVVGKFHLTFVLDMNNATPELAALLNSASLRKSVADKGGFLRIYDKTNPTVATKKLDGLVNKNGGQPTMILQSAGGQVLNTSELGTPNSEQDVINIINKYVR